MRDLPPKVRVNPQLQQVRLKSLMNTLSKSKPVAFCKDTHIYIQSRLRTEVYDVDTFNTSFNPRACRLIKSIENTTKYTNSDRPSANLSPHKKQKGTDTDTPAPEYRTHCNGCGKQHKPPCRLTYMEEYNHENKPYAISSAGMAAAARRSKNGQEALKSIDMLYKGPGEVEPVGSNPF